MTDSAPVEPARDDVPRVPTRELLGLAAIGLAFRAFVAALTPIPSQDGVNYLWMAERFADGEAGRALSEVFPPLWPLLIAPALKLGVDPFRAAQGVACLLGAASIVVFARLTERIVGRGGRVAALFTLLAPLPVRFGAEIYTDALFGVVVAIALISAYRDRYLLAGLAAGLAFWVRPEAALLPVAFALVRPIKTLAMWPPFAACVLGLGYWRSRTGNGFVVEGKLGLHADRLWSDGWSLGPWLGHFFENLTKIPWLWVEGLALVGVLAVWALFAARRREYRPLYWLLGLAIVVICDFEARRRFLAAWFVAVLPLAVAGYLKIPPNGRLPVMMLVLLSNVVLSLRVQASDRYGERIVGEYLATQLGEGETVGGDMTRVIYYAGCRPLRPTVYSVDDLVEMLSAENVRFAVLKLEKTAGPVKAELGELFEPVRMPPEIEKRARERRIEVLRRRKT